MFFTKMEGLGNDYIYIDAGRFPIANPSALSVRLSDRHFGIGGDGIILIGTSKVADFSMRIFNADGSEGLMCGNGARCVGKFVYDKHLTSKTDIALETLSGIKMLHLNIGEDGMVASVAVEMGCYSLTDAPDEMTVDSRTFKGMGVSMGNPHYVTFQDDAEACGTGACATAAAAVERGLVQGPCTIVMDGGSLTIDCDKASRKVVMTGPAVTVFEGSVEV